MTEIKTRWITSQYDPRWQSAARTGKKAAMKMTENTVGLHHLVYAAILDGVNGRYEITDETGITLHYVNRCMDDLFDAGYLRKVHSNAGYMAYEAAL